MKTTQMGSPLLSPLDFTRLAARTFAALPGIMITGIDALELHIALGDRPVQLQLNNFYEEYQATPDALTAIIQALVDTLTELPPDRMTIDPALLLDRIMPMIKPLALLNTVREGKVPMLAYRPFVGELMVTYVIDEGQSVAFVNEQHLTAWAITEEELYRHALVNLRRLPNPAQLLGTGARSLLVIASGDGYAATRLMLPELFTAFTKRLHGELVIGVPNRDFLIAWGDDDPIIFEQVAAQITEDAGSKPYPLTDQLFTIRAEQIQLYQQE